MPNEINLIFYSLLTLIIKCGKSYFFIDRAISKFSLKNITNNYLNIEILKNSMDSYHEYLILKLKIIVTVFY